MNQPIQPIQLSAKISPDALIEMIKPAIEAQVGRKVKDITFVMRVVNKGDYRESWTEDMFDGLNVTFE